MDSDVPTLYCNDERDGVKCNRWKSHEGPHKRIGSNGRMEAQWEEKKEEERCGAISEQAGEEVECVDVKEHPSFHKLGDGHRWLPKKDLQVDKEKFLQKEKGTVQEKETWTSIPNVQKFESGAVRSTDANGKRFDLICPAALQALAATYDEGAKKYGDSNWCKGLPIGDVLHHSLNHIFSFLLGDTNEDHLSHAAWGLFAAKHLVSGCQHHVFGEEMKRKDKEYLDSQRVNQQTD